MDRKTLEWLRPDFSKLRWWVIAAFAITMFLGWATDGEFLKLMDGSGCREANPVAGGCR